MWSVKGENNSNYFCDMKNECYFTLLCFMTVFFQQHRRIDREVHAWEGQVREFPVRTHMIND
jgi:hypothetical protein